MYEHLSVKQLTDMNKQLDNANETVTKKNSKSQAYRDQQLADLDKTFNKQKSKLLKKFVKLEEKQERTFKKLDKKYANKKSTLEYKAVADSLNELFAKRFHEIDEKLSLLQQNYDLAYKDICDGYDGSVSYNQKVYLDKIAAKYSKKNFKLAFEEQKANLPKTGSKKEDKKAVKALKWELYEQSDKLYTPPSIKQSQFWAAKKAKWQLNNLELKKKWVNCTHWTFKEWMSAKVWSVPIYLWIPFIAILVTVIWTKTVTVNMIYAMAILLIISVVVGSIFNKIPIWNKYFGGALLGCMFVGSMLVYFGVFPKDGVVYKTIDTWFRQQDFLSFYISVLLIGAVLLIPRKMILKATGGFFGVILIGLGFATLLGYLASLTVRMSFKTLILDYWLPILCDGNGGGIQPIGKIAAQNGYDGGVWMSKAIAVSTIASVFSVIAAALLNLLGKTKKSLSGDGQLLRQNLHTVEVKVDANHRDVVGSLILILAIYLLSDIFAKLIFPEKVIKILIPNFAWMIVIVMILNLTNCVPPNLKDGVSKINKFISKQTTWLLMFAVGIIYIDLNEFIHALNPTSLLMSLSLIIGIIIGTFLGAKLFKFYAIEAVVSAGLCMTAQGGSGAIMVLGTSERMGLMPWGQITCRIAGSFILIIAGVAFSAWPNVVV